MNKKQLSRKVAARVKLKKAAVERMIDTALEEIGAALQRGEKVRLVGFGNFVVRTRAGRVGRNPQTGAKIEIASSKCPAFVPGINLKNLVKTKQVVKI